MPKWTVKELIESNPQKYEAVLRKRGKDPNTIQEILQLAANYKQFLLKINSKRQEMNKLSEQYKILSKDEIHKKAKQMKEELKEMEKQFDSISTLYNERIKTLPNLLEDDVPEGLIEEDSVPIKHYGNHMVWTNNIESFLEQKRENSLGVQHFEVPWKPRGHAELLEEILKKGDTLQASKVAGSRFYYIFDEIVWLDFAITLYALDFLAKRGYKLVIPPFIVRQELVRSAIDFDTFKEMIYQITGEDTCLIGTSEHPLLGLCLDKVLEEKELPLKLAGYSACFRKEAGAHGKDTKGIFRVHQFNKIEQFIFCQPEMEEGRKYHKQILDNAEELWRNMGLPYRFLNMCAGQLSDQAAKKVDIEVWFPSQNQYREVVSVSNCLDWQSHRGNIVFRVEKTGKMAFPFTLNGTAIPTSRAICAILENYQREDGSVAIPQALRRYLEPFDSAPKEEIMPAYSKSKSPLP